VTSGLMFSASRQAHSVRADVICRCGHQPDPPPGIRPECTQ